MNKTICIDGTAYVAGGVSPARTRASAFLVRSVGRSVGMSDQPVGQSISHWM